MQELPAFQELYEQYQGQIEMLAVAVDDRSDPPKFFADKNFTIPLVKDGDGSQAYNIRSIPRTLIIDAKGNLAKDFTGGISKADLEAAIKDAL